MLQKPRFLTIQLVENVIQDRAQLSGKTISPDLFSEAVFYVTFLILGRLGIVRGHIFRKVQPQILILQNSCELSSNGKSSALMSSFSKGGGMGGLSPTWDLF